MVLQREVPVCHAPKQFAEIAGKTSTILREASFGRPLNDHHRSDLTFGISLLSLIHFGLEHDVQQDRENSPLKMKLRTSFQEDDAANAAVLAENAMDLSELSYDLTWLVEHSVHVLESLRRQAAVPVVAIVLALKFFEALLKVATMPYAA